MHSKNDGSHIVFVVGCPRSGTTWLQRLLAAHAQVHSGPETSLFVHHIGPSLRSFDRKATNVRPTGLGCYFTREEYFQVLEEHTQAILSRLTESVPLGEWWLEKTPSHALWIPEIHEMLPQAKVIHLLRDGRDTVASLLAAGAGWGSYWAPRGAGRAARTWVQHVQAARASQKLLPSGHWMEVRYETLLDDPVPALQQCAEFLNLQWERPALETAIEKNRVSRDKKPERSTPHKNGAQASPVAATPGTPLMVGGEVARQMGHEGQPLCEPAGFIRRAQAGSWKQDLTTVDKWQVNRYAGELLRECGYL